MPKPRPVEIVKQSYQPTEAEEVIMLRNLDGSVPEPDALARALTEPVEITYLEKPKKEGLQHGR